MHQSFPDEIANGLGQEHFDATGSVLAAADQARRKHARIVQHQAIAGMQIAGKS